DTAPKGVLFWRALLSSLGGLAFVVVGLAIAPALNWGGASLTRNVLPRGEGESMDVRLRGVARPLIPVYGILTLACAFALWAAGMPFFDALCHAMSALSTGGFSTREGSVAAFGRPAVEWMLIPFMILGALNFTYHWALLRGRGRAYRDDQEVRGFFI